MEYIMPIVAVLTILGTAFSFFVIKPLNQAIQSLKETIKELRNDVRANEERRHQMELKMIEIDQRARSAHHRIDTIEKELRYDAT